MRLGVISDTHNFLDPRIARLFQGVEHILHAGDIGLPGILQELRQIAPVKAVAGNTDDPGFGYPETEFFEIPGLKFLLHHIVAPHHLTETLQSTIAREKPDVVVFGHTHKPFHERIGPTLFFNPGYAGQSRFGMERTIAILHCYGSEIRAEYLPLQ